MRFIGKFGTMAAGLALVVGLSGCSLVGVCGTEMDLECPEDRYCEFDIGSCGEDNAIGVCTAKPDACTQEFAPVCGCDGETYGNACAAASAGVSIASEGECEEE